MLKAYVKGNLNEDTIYKKLSLLRELNGVSVKYNEMFTLTDKEKNLVGYACRKDCQIDYIVRYGGTVYVIELKTVTALMKGNMSDDKWLTSSRKGYHHIPSPYKQNKVHCDKLAIREKGYIGNYKNIILVPDRCKVVTDYEGVMSVSEFIEFINMEKFKREGINF